MILKRKPKDRLDRVHRICPIEQLEAREMLTTFVVNNVRDSGAGSLRQAILNANAHEGRDRIEFDFTTPAAQKVTIQPIGTLAIDTGLEETYNLPLPGQIAVIQPKTPLPAITDPVVIDGTYSGFSLTTMPGVEIRGDLMMRREVFQYPFSPRFTEILPPEGADETIGLRIRTDDCEVSGLMVNSFTVGVSVSGDSNVIAHNYIGSSVSGSGTRPNRHGIYLASASGNIISSNYVRVFSLEHDWSAGNYVHNGFGITLADSDDNRVVGNYIDGNITGLGTGIYIVDVSNHNVIGGSQSIDKNVLSKLGVGIQLQSGITTVFGNDIVFNRGGIYVAEGSSGSRISSNLIAGNVGTGILVDGSRYLETKIDHNLLGTNSEGASAYHRDQRMRNGSGIVVSNSDSVVVTDNTIGDSSGGESDDAAETAGLILRLHSKRNVVRNNRIGTDSTGRTAIGETPIGILVAQNSDENVIEGNTIGGMRDLGGDADDQLAVARGTGIALIGTPPDGYDPFNPLHGAGATRNVVRGNFIGVDQSGEHPIQNDSFGILLVSADDTLIEDNVVSGNGHAGIAITKQGNPFDADTDKNTIVGNQIGTDANGVLAIPNGWAPETREEQLGAVQVAAGILIVDVNETTIGGTELGDGNVISGNNGSGILIVESEQTTILNNRIGTGNFSGDSVPNTGHGIHVIGRAEDTVIGASDFGNVIGNNGGNGIFLEYRFAKDVPDKFDSQRDRNARNTQIVENRIGVTIGDQDAGNALNGISIENGWDTRVIGNTIGYQTEAGIRLSNAGRLAGERNLIYDNDVFENQGGIFSIGLNNSIGGLGANEGNQVHDNSGDGIIVSGASSVVAANMVEHNDGGIIIHADDANIVGNSVQSNFRSGIVVGGGANGVALRSNEISYNLENGITVADATGTMIGATEAEFGNVIVSNQKSGVWVNNGMSTSILSNSIVDNERLGIDLDLLGVTPNDVGDVDDGPNLRQNFPVITTLEVDDGNTRITGTLNSVPGDYLIQFFANTFYHSTGFGQGETLLGSVTVTTDAIGLATFDESFSFDLQPGSSVSATATSLNVAVPGNTSEFSAAIRVPSIETQVNSTSTGNQFGQSIATAANGNYVVAWWGEGVEGFGVYFRRFNATGQAVDSEEHKVSVSALTLVEGVDVDMDSDGNCVITWSDQQDIFFRRFDAGGQELDTNQIQANTFGTEMHLHPSISVFDDQTFLLSWSRGSDIYARRFTAEGTPIEAEEFRVNVDQTVGHFRPSVASAADGSFMIAWSTYDLAIGGSNILARRFTASGVAAGDEFRVNMFDGDVDYLWAIPSLAMNAAGESIVGWGSCSGGTGDDCGFGSWGSTPVFRRFDAAGQAIEEHEVAASDQKGEFPPSVSIDNEGNFSLTWDPFESQFDANSDIYVRQYQADGLAVTDEVRVHDVTLSDQQRPMIAMQPSGGLVLAWGSAQQDGDGWGVFTRQFEFLSDIQLQEFTADGNDTLQLAYQVNGSRLLADVPLRFYSSTTPSFSDEATLLGEVLLESEDLDVGFHEKEFSIGANAGQIPLPGSGVPILSEDHYILAVADSDDEIAEQDIDPIDEDNAAVFAGVYRITQDDELVVHGTEGDDSITISAQEVKWNQRTFSAVAIVGFRVHAHGGDDLASADSLGAPVQLWGGPGDDRLVGGSASDLLDGGDGNDLLQGMQGDDMISGGAGNDIAWGGEGLDTFDGGEGINSINDAENDESVTNPLELSLSSSMVHENDGPGAVIGIVSRETAGSPGTMLLVNLTSDLPTQIRVPKQVVIPVGASSVEFPIDALDDQVLDGTQTVAIVASANGFTSSRQSIDVLDYEELAITVSAVEINERPDANQTTARVYRSNGADPALDLVVFLAADVNEVVLPSQVTIPAGASYVEFTLVASDDEILDGPREVRITATATGYISGSDTIVVLDNDHEVTDQIPLFTQSGDGELKLAVDGFGAFGSALFGSESATYFDPVGSLASQSTTADSHVAVRWQDEERSEVLSSVELANPYLVGSSSEASSSFTHRDLQVGLQQSVHAFFDADGSQIGSEFVQTYVLTNQATNAVTFELIRFLDAMLSDAGGAADVGGKIDTPTGPFVYQSGADPGSVLVGISSNMSGEESSRFFVGNATDLRDLIGRGEWLPNVVVGDDDGDGRVDFDAVGNIAIAIQDRFHLNPGESVLYVTRAVFGAGDPAEFVNRAPRVADDWGIVVDQENVLVLSVLQNDTDVGGQLNPLSLTIVDEPDSGTVFLDRENGEITYVAESDFFGRQTLSYTIADEQGAISSVATVAISIAVPFQNARLPTDVNDDGKPSALDALLVINDLNRNNGSRQLDPYATALGAPYYDVTGDNRVSALDALRVINHLNRIDSSLIRTNAEAVQLPMSSPQGNVKYNRNAIYEGTVELERDLRPLRRSVVLTDSDAPESQAFKKTSPNHPRVCESKVNDDLESVFSSLAYDIANQWYSMDQLDPSNLW